MLSEWCRLLSNFAKETGTAAPHTQNDYFINSNYQTHILVKSKFQRI